MVVETSMLISCSFPCGYVSLLSFSLNDELFQDRCIFTVTP